jgi:hypothetical protein
MGRFYAKFDSGSAGWVPDLEVDVTFLLGYEFTRYALHNRMFVWPNSSSAALLRDGLFASRSALSTDVYQELDSVNQNGALGIYFPPDKFTGTTTITAEAYTSSLQGIIIPPNSSGSLGYIIRPTASIVSTQTSFVAPTVPLDSASFARTTYESASAAVTAVLNSVTGSVQGTSSRGPFQRIGNNPSRTLHSIWHDVTMSLFAWDDFTPGPPVFSGTFPSGDWYSASNEQCSGDQPSGNNFYDFTFAVGYKPYYANDYNLDGGRMRYQLSWSYTGGGVAGTYASPTWGVSGSREVSGVRYVDGPNSPVSLALNGNTSETFNVQITASYFDATITSSQGPLGYGNSSVSITCP